MDFSKHIFKNKKVNISKLETFGFVSENGGYSYIKMLDENGFAIRVNVTADGEVLSEITDLYSGEIYSLHLVDAAEGKFVGAVRAQYENILSVIAEKCFDAEVFKSRQARELTEYVRHKYLDEPEFLWKKFSGNAVWRRKDNKKWYGALLTVAGCKLGIPSDEIFEIVDLRVNPDELKILVDNKRIFPGWHMNKKYWITVVLNGAVDFSEICRLTDMSCLLAGNKKK